MQSIQLNVIIYLFADNGFDYMRDKIKIFVEWIWVVRHTYVILHHMQGLCWNLKETCTDFKQSEMFLFIYKHNRLRDSLHSA